jgi:hypothetical protein
MTPLAHRILRDMMLPLKDRRFDVRARIGVSNSGELLDHFREEFHCFEVSQIVPLAHEIKQGFLDAACPSVAWSFLPAPRTWIEWRDAERSRLGAMLVEHGEWAEVFIATYDCGMYVGRIALEGALSRYLIGRPEGDPWRTVERLIFQDLSEQDFNDDEAIVFSLLWQVYSFLLLINTPKVIGRATHNPHRKLAREILSRRKLLGIFPLQAWTEILLPVGPATVVDSAGPTGLTGMMPLHWTRAHKKRVHGIWTPISDYWSGDGSLGIKRSRYTVTP